MFASFNNFFSTIRACCKCSQTPSWC